MSIVDYKKALAKRSAWRAFDNMSLMRAANHARCAHTGQTQIEKAKLISKTATKGKI